MSERKKEVFKTSLVATVDSFFLRLKDSDCVEQVYKDETWIGTQIDFEGTEIDLMEIEGGCKIDVRREELVFTVEIFDFYVKVESFFNRNRGVKMPVGGKPFTPKENFECGSFIKLQYQDSKNYFKESLFPWLEECIERGKPVPALPTVIV